MNEVNSPAWSPGAAPAGIPGTVEFFAASTAHDFNNLLTGILGNLELMHNRTRRNGHDEYDSYLDGARSAGSRAAVFAQRLAALSGRHAGEPVATDIAPLIAGLIEPLRATGQRISSSVAPAIILCDPSQAELALTELLDNAIAASPPGGQITLSAARDGTQITIAVHDDGPGMTAEMLARAGQPFFTTRPNGTGRGLGLAIAARFARALGGDIGLSSTPGQGTTARLTLPCEER
jgi:signal transduction histidine kinase